MNRIAIAAAVLLSGCAAAPSQPAPDAEIGGTSVSYVWLDAGKDILLGCAQDNYSYCDIPLRRLR